MSAQPSGARPGHFDVTHVAASSGLRSTRGTTNPEPIASDDGSDRADTRRRRSPWMRTVWRRTGSQRRVEAAQQRAGPLGGTARMTAARLDDRRRDRSGGCRRPQMCDARRARTGAGGQSASQRASTSSPTPPGSDTNAPRGDGASAGTEQRITLPVCCSASNQSRKQRAQRQSLGVAGMNAASSGSAR